ncbi:MULTISPECIES: hypothetical protein [unclassified Rhizobium]|uniref:hypothetical protein n=1 Tax=unclassified Rhizobium TaxID=2613769 RepID=UPI0015CF21F8|nr:MULTISPECIES: hypothetical protein [unclassified Rhizobium]MDF0661682.1 hypothetical protein [Rhizobium sp. BC49]
MDLGWSAASYVSNKEIPLAISVRFIETLTLCRESLLRGVYRENRFEDTHRRRRQRSEESHPQRCFCTSQGAFFSIYLAQNLRHIAASPFHTSAASQPGFGSLESYAANLL